MRCGLLWTHLVLLLFLLVDSTDLTIKSSCRSYCGNTSIPFPFGIGKGCYFNEWFEIKCNNSTSGEPVPYLPKINKEVVSIDLSVPDFYQPDVQQNPYGSLLIKTNITSSMECSNNTDASISSELLNVTGSPFTIDRTNKLVGFGCKIRATLTIRNGCKDIDECKSMTISPGASYSCVDTPGGIRCVHNKKKKNNTLPIVIAVISVAIGVFITLSLCFWRSRLTTLNHITT